MKPRSTWTRWWDVKKESMEKERNCSWLSKNWIYKTFLHCTCWILNVGELCDFDAVCMQHRDFRSDQRSQSQAKDDSQNSKRSFINTMTQKWRIKQSSVPLEYRIKHSSRPEQAMSQASCTSHVDCFNRDQQLSSKTHHPVRRIPVITVPQQLNSAFRLWHVVGPGLHRETISPSFIIQVTE